MLYACRKLQQAVGLPRIQRASNQSLPPQARFLCPPEIVVLTLKGYGT